MTSPGKSHRIQKMSLSVVTNCCYDDNNTHVLVYPWRRYFTECLVILHQCPCNFLVANSLMLGNDRHLICPCNGGAPTKCISTNFNSCPYSPVMTTYQTLSLLITYETSSKVFCDNSCVGHCPVQGCDLSLQKNQPKQITWTFLVCLGLRLGLLPVSFWEDRKRLNNTIIKWLRFKWEMVGEWTGIICMTPRPFEKSIGTEK